MGTHVSKVKSIDLDTWTPEQMESIQNWGNRRANLYWEAHLKAGHSPPDHKLESFVRSKYESRRWALDGPPPQDPSILDSAVKDAEGSGSVPLIHETLPSNTKKQTASQPDTSRQQYRSAQAVSKLPARPTHELLSTSSDLLDKLSTASQGASRPDALNSNKEDLFTLDFSMPSNEGRPVEQTPQVPRTDTRDVKQDILSLYSANPGGTTSMTSSSNTANAWSTDIATANHSAQAGGARMWSAPNDLWQGSQTNRLGFDDSTIWGSSTPNNNTKMDNNLNWHQSASPNDAVKSDAFSDIWSQLR